MKHVARKRFGQHFLVDRAVIESIVRAIDPRDGQRLVEIGPGQAALTDALLGRIASMRAIEIDRDLARWLRSRYPETRLGLIEQDALRADYRVLAGDGPIRLVGNLPYNISSPLLVHLLDFRDVVVDQHFMLQKEVIDRIVAQPGGTDFGRLTVLLQAYYEVDALFDVPPESFDPPPKVMSSVLRMLPRRGPDPVAPAALETVITRGFAQRRKMLRSTLLPWLAAQGVAADEIDPTLRPEDVPVAQWIVLAQRYAARNVPT